MSSVASIIHLQSNTVLTMSHYFRMVISRKFRALQQTRMTRTKLQQRHETIQHPMSFAMRSLKELMSVGTIIAPAEMAA